MEDYRVEVCIALRKLERPDKDEFAEDERADAEEVIAAVKKICFNLFPMPVAATETAR